jgi:nitrogen fixation-related uncharacterized protein|tara:strand:- start:154 stop:309 length:156 start_codon:yes stop_codon:yes gene_type:complete
MIEATMIQFLVSLFMSLGAVCIFVWAVLSGLFNDVEEIKYRAYHAEVNEDE